MHTSTAPIQFGEPVQSKGSENIQTLYVLVLWETRTSRRRLEEKDEKKELLPRELFCDTLQRGELFPPPCKAKCP